MQWNLKIQTLDDDATGFLYFGENKTILDIPTTGNDRKRIHESHHH